MSAKSIDEALRMGSTDFQTSDSQEVADACATDFRTGLFTVENKGTWTIETMFVHLRSLNVKDLPAHYSRDSGVFVAATNVAPGQKSYPVDTCRVGGRNSPICADWIEVGYKVFIIWQGKRHERDFKKGPYIAPKGQFWRDIPSTLGVSIARASEDAEEVVPPEFIIDFNE